MTFQRALNDLPSSNACGIWKYKDLIPSIRAVNQITLGEGNTPLVKSRVIGNKLGISRLYFKLESMNPTGSYKDRIAAVGLSWAIEKGKRACIGTSSGNAGAAVAAYSARAGIPFHLLTIENIVESKLTQTRAYGPKVMRIKQFGEIKEVGDQVFNFIQSYAKEKNWEVMITAFQYNDVAMQAVKTISYEIYQDLGNRVPDAVFIPVGGGGLFTGIWKGFSDLREYNIIDHQMPHLVAVQSRGCANVVKAWLSNLDAPTTENSTSLISGLQVPNPPDGREVLKVLNSGQGWGAQIDDTDTWKWQERLALEEGILCEPASAITMAGVEKAIVDGRINSDSIIICVITGAGYKDSDRLKKLIEHGDKIESWDIGQLENDWADKG